ncbi:MAG: hypothetical protein NZM35_00705 [Chitinophagales bacterium]|nr:hypothetical protein [Chitinophagales bacterium]
MIFCICLPWRLPGNTDSASRNKLPVYDNLHLARLNRSGNMMIAGGVGLIIAGSYLVYQGFEIYRAPAPAQSANPAEDVRRNQRQGTIYMAAGGVALAGGAALAALGIRNKVIFKKYLRYNQLKGCLEYHLPLALCLKF